VITLSSVAGGKWRHAPRRAGLGGAASTHFIQTYNAFFSRNVGQNMLKNVYSFGKKLQNRRSVRGSAPKNPSWPPAAGNSTPRPLVVTLTYWYKFVGVHSSVLNLFYYIEK